MHHIIGESIGLDLVVAAFHLPCVAKKMEGLVADDPDGGLVDFVKACLA